MSSPRFQFTLRRLMVMVALAAVLIWLPKGALRFLQALLDDTYYAARESLTQTWDAGPAPKIDVDLYGGYIYVVQSTDGRVSAVITTSASFKNSQAGADAAVNGVVLTTDHQGDTIRIRATDPQKSPAFLKTDVSLRIPPGASLDLVTAEGYINIGQRLPGPGGVHLVSSPVALKSVKARDLGNTFTGMEAEILSDPSSPATVLDLESRRGSIRIKGDNLLVKARADAGGIEYAGRLAPGSHSFETGPFQIHADSGWRLEKGIRLVLPADLSFGVHAASARNAIQSRFPLSPDAPELPGVLAGTVGADPRIKLDLKSDYGPIYILQGNGEPPPPSSGPP